VFGTHSGDDAGTGVSDVPEDPDDEVVPDVPEEPGLNFGLHTSTHLVFSLSFLPRRNVLHFRLHPGLERQAVTHPLALETQNRKGMNVSISFIDGLLFLTVLDRHPERPLTSFRPPQCCSSTSFCISSSSVLF